MYGRVRATSRNRLSLGRGLPGPGNDGWRPVIDGRGPFAEFHLQSMRMFKWNLKFYYELSNALRPHKGLFLAMFWSLDADLVTDSFPALSYTGLALKLQQAPHW